MGSIDPSIVKTAITVPVIGTSDIDISIREFASSRYSQSKNPVVSGFDTTSKITGFVESLPSDKISGIISALFATPLKTDLFLKLITLVAANPTPDWMLDAPKGTWLYFTMPSTNDAP